MSEIAFFADDELLLPAVLRQKNCGSGKGAGMVRQIVIELETPGDSRTMFRLRIDGTRIADDLTAVQAHILVGEILERIVLPKPIE